MADFYSSQTDENLQLLKNAVVTLAVEDLALYEVLKVLAPELENGEPPESIFDGIKEECMASAAKAKKPIIKKGKELTEEQYAAQLMKHKKESTYYAYKRIQKDGIASVRFFADEAYLSIFTDIDLSVFQRAIRLKKEQMLLDVEQGNRFKRPPWGYTGRKLVHK